MYINFDEVAVLKSVGICYFSHNTEGLKNMNKTELSELHNQWLTDKDIVDHNNGYSKGSDVRCQIVHIGKSLEGNKKRLRIAVYREEDRMNTVILFQTNQVREAIATMYAMAGYGELTCCE